MKDPRSNGFPLLVVHGEKPPTVLSATLEVYQSVLTERDESRPYASASSIFFLDKHLVVFAIFINKLATSRKYAQNE